jgi:hypothetical protein
MKRIYLHVGNFKTGTSAIQRFCHQHQAELLEQGLCYPQSARPAGAPNSHSALPLSLFNKYAAFTPRWYAETEPFGKTAQALRSELDASEAESFLISSEELFRFPSLPEAVLVKASEDFARLFAGYEVAVIMYVREPLSFAKSWYNQINKSPLPCGRFSNFVYYLQHTYMNPEVNARFWRNMFGDDALIIRPYTSNPDKHIDAFLALMGITPSMPAATKTDRINPGRNEGSLEADRLAKVYSLSSIAEREVFLRSDALKSTAAIAELKQKIDTINTRFNKFCDDEGLTGMRSKLTLEEILVHEEKVNQRLVQPGWHLRRFHYRAVNHPTAVKLINFVKRLKA